LITDPYRFAYVNKHTVHAAQDSRVMAADGALIILYRATANGFENVALLPLAW
jgi:hypothetical protein